LSIQTLEFPDALILLHSQAPAVKVWFDEQAQRLRFTEIDLDSIYARPIEPTITVTISSEAHNTTYQGPVYDAGEPLSLTPGE
jgi:hypothetical protein